MKSRALALITVALLAACSQRSEQDLLTSAQKRLEQKDSAGAVIELKNALQQNADSVQARALLGRALPCLLDLAQCRFAQLCFSDWQRVQNLRSSLSWAICHCVFDGSWCRPARH